MKIRVEHGDFDENEIVLRCKELDDEALEVLALLRERSVKLTGYVNGEAHIINPGKLLYAEAVDGKTFLYTADMVLQTHQSLAALESAHAHAGLIRIGKSQLVNLHHVMRLRSIPNSRIEITLKNSEKLIVSRHYTAALKERLGMQEQEEL